MVARTVIASAFNECSFKNLILVCSFYLEFRNGCLLAYMYKNTFEQHSLHNVNLV